MQETTNYKLKKIELADSPPDITAMNPNWDTIDAKLKTLEEQNNSLEAELENVSSATDYTATLLSTGWIGSQAPYSKAVTVTGILATDTPFVDIVPTGTYATDIQMETDWSNIYRIVTSADTITFYSHVIPTANIPIQIKVVR